MCTQFKGYLNWTCLSSKKSVSKNKQILDSVSVKYFLLQKIRYVQGQDNNL